MTVYVCVCVCVCESWGDKRDEYVWIIPKGPSGIWPGGCHLEKVKVLKVLATCHASRSS